MDEILRGKSVMVVDDTAVNRLVAADILTTAGMTVVEAESGEQALQQARDQPIDAFLLDVRMGEMNGIEVCRTLRNMPSYANTPVIFVTAVDQREVLQWALEAGADDYIQKPLHAMVLRRRLANLLQKAASIRQAELMSLSLQRYVSPRTEEIARVYAAHGKLPTPRREDACVLFSDARGFTELGRDLEPELLFELLSGALAAQVALVNKHDGYVDKFSGDGVMAVFHSSNMVAKCCRCALDMLDQSKEYAVQKGLDELRLGIGIHYGSAMVGNLGSDEHLDYTLVGTPVNLAARLCGSASQSIVVSQAVRDNVDSPEEFEFANKRLAPVRGFPRPLTVYDLQRA